MFYGHLSYRQCIILIYELEDARTAKLLEQIYLPDFDIHARKEGKYTMVPAYNLRR